MRASWLGNKEVLKLLERNYRLYCATRNIPVDDSIAEDDDGEYDETMDDETMDDEMDVDENAEPAPGDDEEEWGGITDADGARDADAPSFFDQMKASGAQLPKTKSRRKKTRVALLIREKVRRVLEDATELADRRSGKLEENDFLRLLHAFNEEGIHFS